MTGRDRIVLQKIVGYIQDVIAYTDGVDFEGFMQDKKTMSACAFAVGQIGELV